MANQELSVGLISGLLGSLLSLLLEVIPGLSDWWNEQESETKRLVWLGGCIAVPAVLYLISCVANINLGIIMPGCDVDGVVQAIIIGGSAYLGSQGTFAVAGRPIRAKLNGK